MRHRAAARAVAHHAGKCADRARAIVRNGRLQPPCIQGIGRQLEQDPRAMRPAAHRRDERRLVAVLDGRGPVAELLVEGAAHCTALRQPRMPLSQGFVNLGQR